MAFNIIQHGTASCIKCGGLLGFFDNHFDCKCNSCKQIEQQMKRERPTMLAKFILGETMEIGCSYTFDWATGRIVRARSGGHHDGSMLLSAKKGDVVQIDFAEFPPSMTVME